MFGKRRKIREIEEKAAIFENEVRGRIAKMADPDALTEDNIRLQLFVIKYDSDRYLNDPFYSKNSWLYNAGLTFLGFIDVYEAVLNDGLDVWLKEDYLINRFNEYSEELRTSHSAGISRREKMCRAEGKRMAVAGLLDGELYYSWTDSFIPITINQRFIKSMNERNIYND